MLLRLLGDVALALAFRHSRDVRYFCVGRELRHTVGLVIFVAVCRLRSLLDTSGLWQGRSRLSPIFVAIAIAESAIPSLAFVLTMMGSIAVALFTILVVVFLFGILVIVIVTVIVIVIVIIVVVILIIAGFIVIVILIIAGFILIVIFPCPTGSTIILVFLVGLFVGFAIIWS